MPSFETEALEDSLSLLRLLKTSGLFAVCGINCVRLLWVILDLLLKFDMTLIQLSFEDECCDYLSLEQNPSSLLSSCSSFDNSSQHKHVLTTCSVIVLAKFRYALSVLNSLSAILPIWQIGYDM
jgi:hypothetical protein